MSIQEKSSKLLIMSPKMSRSKNRLSNSNQKKSKFKKRMNLSAKESRLLFFPSQLLTAKEKYNLLMPKKRRRPDLLNKVRMTSSTT